MKYLFVKYIFGRFRIDDFTPHNSHQCVYGCDDGDDKAIQLFLEREVLSPYCCRTEKRFYRRTSAHIPPRSQIYPMQSK